MEARTIERRVSAHYGRDRLDAAILEALGRAGVARDAVTVDDLAAADELHVCGAAATDALGDALDLRPGMATLDIGCGLGGPMRRVASRFGCRMFGVDLTEAYCRAAARLNEAVGIGGAVACAGALTLPFADRSFDRVMTQHVVMNVADKNRFYAEAFRVLKPGGRLGGFDLLRGPGEAPLYPAPWARDSSTSFLVGPDELRQSLANAGFEIVAWRDRSDDARAWLEALRRRRAAEGPPSIDLGVTLGPGFPEMAKNQARNLREGRVAPTEFVCVRPAP